MGQPTIRPQATISSPRQFLPGSAAMAPVAGAVGCGHADASAIAVTLPLAAPVRADLIPDVDLSGLGVIDSLILERNNLSLVCTHGGHTDRGSVEWCAKGRVGHRVADLHE